VLPHEVQSEVAPEISVNGSPFLAPTLLTSAPDDDRKLLGEEQRPGAGLQPRKGRRQARQRFDTAPMELSFGSQHSGSGRNSWRKPDSPSSTFYDLMSRLAEQHENELTALRAENAALKAQLHAGEGSAADAADTEAATSSRNPLDHNVHWGGVERKSVKDHKEHKDHKDDRIAPFLLSPQPKSLLDEPSSGRRPSVVSATNSRRHSTCSGRRLSRRNLCPTGDQLLIASQLASMEAIELLPMWQEKEAHRRAQRRRSTHSGAQLRMSKVRQSDLDQETLVLSGGTTCRFCAEKVVVHPSSLKRLFWDLVGFTLLSYDIIMIPFASAFEPGESHFTEAVNWMTLAFWSTDMIASMLTGFQKGGVTVMSHSQIITRYFRTWFLLDCCIVGLDWAMLVAYGGAGDANEAIRQGRSLRMLRYVRTIRLIRLLKLKRMFHEIQDHINTELLSTVFSILKTIVGLVVANHLIACAWYALGASGADSQPSWVRANDLLERTIAYRYTTSLHWSLTQFTPASMEVRPYNEGERIFAVIVLLLALVSFSSFVSTLTASITRLSAMRSNEYRQFWLLRRYLRELQISRQLSLRVQRFCEYSWERQHQSVQERDVLLLTHLSEPLREQLKAETFAPHLSIHPLIEQLQECARHFSMALDALEIARGDQVFGYGEVAHEMFFVARGELQYSVGRDEEPEPAHAEQQPPAEQRSGGSAEEPGSESEDSESSEEGIESVFESDWVSEAALWTLWDHLGYLEALSDCQLVAVKAAKFSEVVSQNAATWSSAQKYAKRFVEELNKVEKHKLSDVLERNITFLSASEVGCLYSPVRSSTAIIRKRERRKGFGVSEYRLRCSTQRLLFRLSLATQSAINHLRRRFSRG